MKLKNSSAQNLSFSVFGSPAKVSESANKRMVVSYQDGRDEVICPHEFDRHYREGKIYRIQPERPIERRLNLSLNQQLEKARIDDYLTHLYEVTGGAVGGVEIRQQVINRVWNMRGRLEGDKPSPTTVWRWHRKAQESSSGTACIVASDIREKKSKYEGSVRSLADEYIRDHYLQGSEPSMMASYQAFLVSAIDEYQISSVPGYTTFRNWINEFDELTIIGARKGPKALRMAKRAVRSNFTINRVLERVEVDAGNISIGVTDEYGNVLTTVVTIYIVLDCFSRSVLGFTLQLGKGESAASVIDSYIHAIAPKDPKDYFYCESDYPMQGTPLTIVTDGGPGYTSRAADEFCMAAGITPTTVETGRGDKKPFVESFIRTLRLQLFRELPGYCGKFSDDRELEAPVDKQAVMKFTDLQQVISQYIIDVYHHQPHSGLSGKTPYQIWTENTDSFTKYSSLPSSFETLRTMRGQIERRTIQAHHGVQISGIFYNSKELQDYYHDVHMPGDPNPKVLVEFSPNDISEISVVDEQTNEVILAIPTDPSITEGMTLQQYKILNPRSETEEEDRLNAARRMRKLRQSQTLADARATHSARIKAARSSSMRRHQANEITKGVHQAQLVSGAKSGLSDLEDDWELGDNSVIPTSWDEEGFDLD
ncbi:Mu transposase C-terminal domain-containing protein [Amphritea sp.]|uniref:Mu transposase C-terminal domain-containing protein n=1 Tax=Amphritea sp. TaxID=1872502 RepID=UPI003D0F2115